MSSSEKKTIKLSHNGFIIHIEISNDYKEIMETIRNAIYLKPEEMEKLTIMFKDEEGDNNPLDEENFTEAFNAEEWCTKPNSEANEEERKLIDENNIERMKNREEEMKSKFIEIMNNKITEINNNWKQKLEKSKISFKNELNKRENLYQKNLEQIMGNMSTYVNNVIDSGVDKYNKEIKDVYESQVKEGENNFKNEDQGMKSNLENMQKVYNNIKDDVDKSKISFVDILKFSGLQK